MRAFLANFLIVSGLVFWILLAIAAYLFFGVPMPESAEQFVEPIKEQLRDDSEYSSDAADTDDASSPGEEPSDSGRISDEQAQALRAFGIDPSAVQNVTPEQEACFVRTLGQERVDEIKSGATPGPADYFKAKVCL